MPGQLPLSFGFSFRRPVRPGSIKKVDGSEFPRRGRCCCAGHYMHAVLRTDHIAIGSINSPVQCTMNEVCEQCLRDL